MRALKAQYFCAFGVMGCVVPYLAVFLDARGLGPNQIGLVLATMGGAIMVSPVLMTLLADAHFENRTLVRAGYLLTAAAMAGLWTAERFWGLFACHALMALALWPMMQLQDGLQFHVHQQRKAEGHAHEPYHRVRVWGTLGFIVPSLALWGLLRAGADIDVILLAGITVCAAGACLSFALPRVGADEVAARGARRLPTLEAARRMREPHLLLFALAMLLVHLSVAGYYAFYPLYLTQAVGLGQEWLGVIANLGVVVEIFFMMGFGRLLHRLGMRGLLVAGALAVAARLGLLFAAPTVAVAVGTQVFHGLTVLLVHVAPPVYLNHHADPAFRNSMQGFFAMTVYGTGRIAGNVLAGLVAEHSLFAVFGLGAGLTLAAVPLFLVALRRDPTGGPEP
jgi:PPP family 3-phenylpropionic acid transporter